MEKRLVPDWAHGILMVVVGTGVLLGQAGAVRAELNGDCALEGRLNPGLGCSSSSKGKPCTIKGTAGTCTNMKRPIEDLYYCVCLPADNKVPQEVEGKATTTASVTKSCGMTATFQIDPSAPQIIDAVLPQSLGRQVVRFQEFSGWFTVSTRPIPGNPNACSLVIQQGQIKAPSATLPDGTQSGTNTFVFGPPDLSGGTLDLKSGAYTAFAAGVISNSRVGLISTAGSYRGTFDFATASVSLDSTTLDTYP